ncbi:MAG: preprotein translocase subunit YajC [Clostridia bacterium]|nr:preprotein translocase subunit YajC [Clostridia bacterium]
MQYLPIILVFALMIGMSFFSQRKQKKQLQERLDSLRVGVTVRTAGGFVGTIAAVMEDSVIVELNPDKVRVELLKGAVAPLEQPLNQPEEALPEEEAAEEAPAQEEPTEE